jgi:hypothetical protein
MDLTNATLDSLDFRLSIDVVSRMTKEEVEAIRMACLTNLRFLANCVLRPPNSKKFPSLLEKVHGRIIDALVKPSPYQDLEDWSVTKEAVILASRGMVKSTIGGAFLTQVILCAPDVRILIISGKMSKAESILGIARDPFFTNEVLRFLFPEFAIEQSDLRVGEFITPRRNPELNFRDPTLETSSFDSIKAGGHYELIFFDDATNEINSNNIENCEKTHGQYDDTDPLVEPGGYRIFFGTKWLDDDLPAHIMKKSNVEREITGQATATYFFLPAWTLKTSGTPVEVDQRLQREKTGGLTPDDVNFTWPEKLSARFLFPMYRGNRTDFYKQYLLDTSIEQQKSFLPEILEKQLIPGRKIKEMVQNHDFWVFIHWDLAGVVARGKKKSESDYSCGIVAMFQKSTGKMFVINCHLAHFSGGDDIAKAIVKLFMWAENIGPIHGHSIEDAAGSRLLEDSIERAAQSMKPRKWMTINYIVPDQTIAKAKNSRIAVLASAMASENVFIANDMPYIAEIKAQLSNWDINSQRRKDDGPDCIASIWQHYKGMIEPNAISSLQTEGPILSWEPEGPIDAPDPHAEEKENADIAWLSNFTCPHA